MFVGDSWHDDVGGALAAGLTPVHVSRTAACDVGDHGDVRCIGGLGDLPELLWPGQAEPTGLPAS